jgi:alpha-mannosidase/alpha-mannosidase II/lysosomal alpha-mannosidase
LDYAFSWATFTSSPLLLLPWGGDYRWQNASLYFNNMTKIVNYINSNTKQYGATIQYSTPSEYFRDLARENVTYDSHVGTFEPYNGGHASEAAKG